MLQIKWIVFATQIFIFCIFITYIFLYALTSQYDQRNPDAHPRKAGVVLGAALWDNQPSPALVERLDQAIKLYKQNKIEYIILSGGLGKARISEAKAMQIYLIQHGISPEKLILEDQSTNTRENLRYTAQIIADRSFGQVYLITHDYHMYRALNYAKQAKIEAVPAPVHSKVLWTPYHKTRECLALIKQKVFRY